MPSELLMTVSNKVLVAAFQSLAIRCEQVSTFNGRPIADTQYGHGMEVLQRTKTEDNHDLSTKITTIIITNKYVTTPLAGRLLIIHSG